MLCTLLTEVESHGQKHDEAKDVIECSSEVGNGHEQVNYSGSNAAKNTIWNRININSNRKSLISNW